MNTNNQIIKSKTRWKVYSIGMSAGFKPTFSRSIIWCSLLSLLIPLPFASAPLLPYLDNKNLDSHDHFQYLVVVFCGEFHSM